jgi:hypothetical protein
VELAVALPVHANGRLWMREPGRNGTNAVFTQKQPCKLPIVKFPASVGIMPEGHLYAGRRSAAEAHGR